MKYLGSVPRFPEQSGEQFKPRPRSTDVTDLTDVTDVNLA